MTHIRIFFYTAMAVFVWLIGGGIINPVFAVLRWSSFVYHFGFYGIRASMRMVDIQSERYVPQMPAPKRRGFYLDTVATLFALNLSIAIYQLYPSVVVLVVCWCLVVSPAFAFVMVSVPPAVLFLGLSNEDGLRDAAKVAAAVLPLQCVQLLDASRIPVDLTRISDNWLETKLRLSGTNYRIESFGIWRNTVRSLVDAAVLVIIDTRYVSPALIFEFQHLINSSHWTKTLFLTKSTVINSEYGINENFLPHSEKWRLVPEQNLVPLVERFLREQRAWRRRTASIKLD